MSIELPIEGAANPQLQAQVRDVWLATAQQQGFDLSGFDPASPLEARLAWAKSRTLEIATAEARYSTRIQHSTGDQVIDAVRYAVAHKMYLAPELVCVDEGVSGRKVRRDGLNRVKLILERKLATVLLVYKVSRLFRVAYRGFQFFQEQVVDEGLRAISISQGIDTSDTKTWKQLAYLHGIMDEMLLSTITDH